MWKRLLTSPLTPVLIGLAIVLSAGMWVLKEDAPTSGDKAGQADKSTSNAGNSTPAQPGNGNSDTSGGTSNTGSSGTGDSGTGGSGTGGSGTGGSGTGDSGTGGSGTGGSGTGGSGTGTSTKPATPPNETSTPSDQATLAGRAKINRSEGAAKSMLVTAYYADGLKNVMSLQPVEIKVARSVARIKATAEQVINAPQDLKLYSSVPAGTKVLGVNLKNGVAIVDLSPEAAKVRGSAAVNNIMASFVYSLTAIPDVKSVQLWVNGRPALLDGFEWSKPLSRADLEGRNLFKVEPVIKYAGS
ncbi:MAG: GerMN domain-containing protein [Bacillota bacterium]